MKKNIPQLILLVMFLFRIMLPITNAAYLPCLLSMGKNDLWVTVFMVSLLPEIAALVTVTVGFRSPEARRISAYVTFALSGLHFTAFLVPFLFLGGYRQFIGPIFMTVLLIAYAATVALAIMTLRTVREMPIPERKALPPKEIGVCVEALHDKLNSNL